MYDRPNSFQLLAAVKHYLRHQVIPALETGDGQTSQALLAIELLGIVEREMQMGYDHLKAEWTRLNFVENVTTALPDDPKQARDALAERNRKLCEAIRAGRYDFSPARAALFEHLWMNARTQLEVSNPRLLEALAAEDAKKFG